MAVSIGILERRARYVMGGIAIIAVAGLAAFKLGWVSTTPTYKEGAWYLVGGNADIVITSEYADEATCRQKQNGSSVCRSGKVLMEEARGYVNTHS